MSSSNPQQVSRAGGTLVYAAPEVFGGVVGKPADIYSLGASNLLVYRLVMNMQ